MEDMYKLVKDFFSHDMDLDDLFDSELLSGLTGARMTKMWCVISMI